MGLYGRLADLPVKIEDYQLEGLKSGSSSGFERHSTIIHFSGQGHEGLGEDVTYDPKDQLGFQKDGPKLDFAGTYTLDEFSNALTAKKLFTKEPGMEAFYNYRRWAFESAALSLALKQVDTTLAEVLSLKLQPLNFSVSTRLGQPSSAQRVKEILEIYPKLRFKLDPANDWTDELIEELAATNSVDVLDLKSFYKGTPVDVQTDPKLYRKIVESFPRAYIEDPDVNEETRPILQPHADRITWDAPIHSVKDIQSMVFVVKAVNIKPSRFGSLRELLDTYEYCKQNNIIMYGGGQFELGHGRHQIQYLAALFHPDSGNDVAPIDYNLPQVRKGLPTPPLSVKEPF
jgi:hypothetical protein